MQAAEQNCDGAHTRSEEFAICEQHPLVQSALVRHVGVQTALGPVLSPTHLSPRQHPVGSVVQIVLAG
jgi:hypothetical protein